MSPARKGGQDRPELFRSLVERADYGVWVADAGPDFVFVNPRFSDMLGHPVDEVVGRSLWTFVDYPERRADHAGISSPQGGLWRFRRRDETYAWALVCTFPIPDSARGRSSEIGGLVIALHDLSIQYGPITLDFWRLTTAEDGHEVSLTYQETRLLRYFLQHRGRPIARGRLLADLWGQTHDPRNRTVDVHVCHLRQKLRTIDKSLVSFRGGVYLLKAHPDTDGVSQPHLGANTRCSPVRP